MARRPPQHSPRPRLEIASVWLRLEVEERGADGKLRRRLQSAPKVIYAAEIPPQIAAWVAKVMNEPAAPAPEKEIPNVPR